MQALELWWLGQSGFRLRDLDGSTVVFLDPFLSDDPERTWPAPVQPQALARATAVLCSHEHIDHFDRPALRAANQVAGAKFKLVVPEPIVPDALELGIPRERVIGAQPGETITLDGLQVHPVRAKHGVHMSDAYSFGEAMSHGEVRYLGYVVEVGGVRAYHAGDTIPYPGQVDDVRPFAPHLAMLPINGRDFFRENAGDIVGNMDPREAAHTAADIGAQVLIPMHWEMFAKNRGFPRDLVAYAASELPQLSVVVFGRGAKFIYGPPD